MNSFFSAESIYLWTLCIICRPTLGANVKGKLKFMCTILLCTILFLLLIPILLCCEWAINDIVVPRHANELVSVRQGETDDVAAQCVLVTPRRCMVRQGRCRRHAQRRANWPSSQTLISFTTSGKLADWLIHAYNMQPWSKLCALHRRFYGKHRYSTDPLCWSSAGSCRLNLMTGRKWLRWELRCKLRQQHVYTLSLKQRTWLFFPLLLLLPLHIFCIDKCQCCVFLGFFSLTITTTSI